MSRDGEPVRPFLLLGESRRQQLAAYARTAVGRWSHSWLSERESNVAAEVHDGLAVSAAARWGAGSCFRAVTAAGADLYLAASVRAVPVLAGARGSALDGHDGTFSPGTLAGALEEHAFQLLATELLAVAGGWVSLQRLAKPTMDALRELRAERFPTITVTLSRENAQVAIVLSPQLVAAVLPSARKTFANGESLVRRMSATSHRLVGLQALLGHAEVSVAELAGLSVGDVVVLDEALSESSELKVMNGRRIARGSLGNLAGRRALQVQISQQ